MHFLFRWSSFLGIFAQYLLKTYVYFYALTLIKPWAAIEINVTKNGQKYVENAGTKSI